MQAVRPPAVAGSFYPARPAELDTLVAGLVREAARRTDLGPPPKALLVPHAGYVYSGPYAALGYAALAPARGRVRRVVLLGPTHRVAVAGLALPEARAFETPLGRVPVETPASPVRAALPQLVDSWAAHAPEHSLEVQLPFLQACLGTVTVLPLAVGRASPEAVADVLEAVWGGPETVLVVSSDLSHYLPHDRARQVDDATLERVLRLDGPLGHDRACGATPLNGLLVAARRRSLRARLLGAGTSGDTAGDRRRVVGYAAVAFDE